MLLRHLGDGRIGGELLGAAGEGGTEREERHEGDVVLLAEGEHVLVAAVDDAESVLYAGDVDQLRARGGPHRCAALEMPIRSSLPSLRMSSSAPSCSASRSSESSSISRRLTASIRSTCERAQVVLEALTQILGTVPRQPPALLVASRAELGHQPEVVGVGIERVVDQLVDDVGAVVLGGVDVVDAELDRAAQDRVGRVGVARRAEHAGPGELHRAEADAVYGLVAQIGCLGHG